MSVEHIPLPDAQDVLDSLSPDDRQKAFKHLQADLMQETLNRGGAMWEDDDFLNYRHAIEAMPEILKLYHAGKKDEAKSLAKNEIQKLRGGGPHV